MAAIHALVDRLDRIVTWYDDPRAIAPRVAAALRPALDDDALLERRHQEPAADRYRQHLVHVDATGRYSIVALVWRPGQATPIHDHRCWCVVGVWRGLERETAYDLHVVEGRERLVERESILASRGEVQALVPPAEDIHRVENHGNSIAISLHVYGDDIGRLGSSINRTFDDSCVVEGADGARASWRQREVARG
jgi:3-mercaptopropionate dioxygenase